jgi:DNA helicase-2/ATP-dependent DNA helicase PcrA
MTFARRMAAEMTRRVGHICAQAFKGRAAPSANAIEWSGTFHAIGAKLLRLHAESIGLNPSFSILDRGDAEDLLDLVRDDLGLAKSRKRFPKKSTCLAIYSYAVNAQTPRSPGYSPRTSTPSRRRARSTTTTCCCTGRK